MSHVNQKDQNQKPDLASITTSRRLDGLDGHDFWGSGRGGSVCFQGLRVFSKTKSRAYPARHQARANPRRGSVGAMLMASTAAPQLDLHEPQLSSPHST